MVRSDVYVSEWPKPEDGKRFLTRNDDVRLLSRLFDISAEIMPYDHAHYIQKIPEDAETHEALYTSRDSRCEISDETGRLLPLVVLRNKPYDMGDVLITRVVVPTEGASPISLIRSWPLLSIIAGPSGPHFADSPLLYDQQEPTKWVSVVSEVMEAAAS